MTVPVSDQYCRKLLLLYIIIIIIHRILVSILIRYTFTSDNCDMINIISNVNNISISFTRNPLRSKNYYDYYVISLCNALSVTISSFLKNDCFLRNDINFYSDLFIKISIASLTCIYIKLQKICGKFIYYYNIHYV